MGEFTFHTAGHIMSYSRIVPFSKFVFVFVSLGVLLSGCRDEHKIIEITGATMGTTYTAKIVTLSNSKNSHITTPNEPPISVEAHIKGQVDHRLNQINEIMSTYIENSEISLLNTQVMKHDFNQVPFTAEVSEALASLLGVSLEMNTLSESAFDITVGGAVNQYGFGSNIGLSSHTLYNQNTYPVEIKDRTVSFNQPATIDLSAIAKGWAVDEIASLLETSGYTDYMVEIGGEIYASGTKLGNPWRIAIEQPAKTAFDSQSAFLVVPLENAAMATSGDYRNYRVVDGKRISHTINPLAGQPVTHQLASVTVVHDSTMLADAWATSLNVLGEEKGPLIADKHNLVAFFITNSDDAFTSIASAAFKKRFPEVLEQLAE